MLYMILGTDGPGSLELRSKSRGAHLDRVTALRDAGRLVLAGPCPAIDAREPGLAGFTGSLIVAEFDSLDGAQQWADADPYRTCGAWAVVEVKPFVQVLP